ncbi:MAG: hypothetical protein AB2535_20640, partial [Candidatus Thiodiazotropha endolucinida]
MGKQRQIGIVDNTIIVQIRITAIAIAVTVAVHLVRIRKQAAVVFAVCDAVVVPITVCAEKSTSDGRYRLLLQIEVFRDTAVADLAYQATLPIV